MSYTEIPKIYISPLQQYQAKTKKMAIQSCVLLSIVIICMWFTGLLNGVRLAEGVPSIAKLFMEMMPPDFNRWRQWGKPLIDTLAMSVAGTAMAVMLSLPLGLLAAGNTSTNNSVYHGARVILNFLRAVPELIMGIIFVAAVGFGMLPGVLALGLHSVGMVGKFFAEAIEHVDPQPIEAAKAAGADHFQVIWHAVLPQVFPKLADITIYRWEYNFRASTVMGMVGAGGIGFELIGSLRLMQYQEVSAILICLIVMVTVVDSLGALIRHGLK